MNHATVRFMDCLVCVFAPHVLRDPVSVSQSFCNLVQECLVASPISLCLKAPVHSVSVCWFLNVFPACVPCFLVN